ncbi:MAG TPA: Wzz/FepE/Etk N-terminal domain-containing protein [Rhizobacter sp.]|nr:Wzz/FepE/Etk N-terminal domain-containing protein [Rhizobacter sp.]
MKQDLDEATVHADEMDDEGPSIGLLDLLTWLGEGKRLIGSVVGIAAVGSIVFALLQPNVFTARMTLLPPNSQQQSGSAAALAALGSLGGLAGSVAAKTPDELYVNLLKSDSVQRALASKFDLGKRYHVETYEVLRKVMQQYIRISSDKKSGVITVEVDDQEPKFAANLANAHAAEVTKLLSRLAVSEAQQRRLFFEQQLKDTKEGLIQAEQDLRVVQEKSGMIVLDKQSEAIIKAVAELKAQIIEREVRLKVLRTGTTAQNPDVQLLASELTALRGELARMESATPASAPSDGKGSIDIPIGNLPATAVNYARALREVKFQESLMGSMLRQFEVAKLDEAKDAPSLQQIDVAMPPDRKSKPARAVIVVATTLVALLLSSLVVIWRRYRALLRERDPQSAQAWETLARAWRLRRPKTP